MVFVGTRFKASLLLIYGTYFCTNNVIHLFQTILVESQDKALRRIAELKEQCQLEQKAKAHLEDALRNDLEEKDHLISTLYTKIELLKLNGGKEEPDPNNQKVNSSENLLIDLSEGEPSILVPMKHPQEDPALINETNLVLKGKQKQNCVNCHEI